MEAKRIPLSAETLKNAFGISEEIIGMYHDTANDLFYIYTDGIEEEKESVVLEMNYA